MCPKVGATTKPSVSPTPDESDVCVVRRGDQWMEQGELRGHLAALMRLENVGVLLGAGASCGDLGGQGMTALWDNFTSSYEESHTWLIDQHFLSSEEEVPNVEVLVDSLEVARLEWKRRNYKLLNELIDAQSDVIRAVVNAALLQKGWWEDPSQLRAMPMELLTHRQLLQKLVAARQPGQPSPWVFTTNYDLAIEWAAESVGLKTLNGFSGLHLRTFAPQNFDLAFRNAMARGEARFGTYHVYLAKLHGSLNWSIDEEDEIIEQPATLVWPRLKAFAEKSTNTLGQHMVLPSAAKYLQTVGFALGELLRRFTEFLSRPQTCLITCGYSFSDEHLNRILISALQNPTLHLVIYCPEAGRNDATLTMPEEKKWLKRVAATESPQVTFVGGGEEAFLSSLVRDLPAPALHDEQAAKIRKALQSLLKAE